VPADTQQRVAQKHPKAERGGEGHSLASAAENLERMLQACGRRAEGCRPPAVPHTEIFHAVAEHRPQRGSGSGDRNPPPSLQHRALPGALADEAGPAVEGRDNKKGDDLRSSLHHRQFLMCQHKSRTHFIFPKRACVQPQPPALRKHLSSPRVCSGAAQLSCAGASSRRRRRRRRRLY